MYECGNCQRQFTTKGSLHRHEKNHQQTLKFTCSICNVNFVRRDLLTRHARMHKDVDSSANTGRTRSRKACNACRNSRIKCDGQNPCERCKSRDLSCTFTDNEQSHRTSREIGFPALTSPMTTTSPTSNYSDIPVNMQTIEGDDNGALGNDSDLPELPMQPLSFSPIASAWPWLHENLFLQSAVSLDFFDLNGDNSQTQTAAVSNNQPLMHDSRVSTPANESRIAPPDCGNESKEGSVSAIITCASRWTKKWKHQQPNSNFEAELNALSRDVVTVFELEEKDNCMQAFVKLYEENFWPLWPLISRYQLHFYNLHPFLYLAMVSIGAMYGGKSSGAMGTVLHNQLREELIKPLFDYDIADEDLISLGQARSLTQAAALYFGQRKAFSFAQHISATLIAQARRTNLFTAHPSNLQDFSISTAWLEGWIRMENRKRLAFAILRLEMYTSVLLYTRPLVSAEELEIEVPCSRFLWHNNFDSAFSFAAAVKQEMSTQPTQPLFSDLVRITFDPDENLPQLGTLAHELIFNSVQELVWKACSSRDSLERLTGCDIFNMLDGSTNTADNDGVVQRECTLRRDQTSGPSLDHSLVLRSRAMQTLTLNIANFAHILERCHRSLISMSSSLHNSITTHDRTSLLSCLLTYHISHLQLHTPIPFLHSTCNLYNPTASSSVASPATGVSNKRAFSVVKSWSSTKSAGIAREQARQIYHILRSEADRTTSSRASVNFLTTIGLYHSAVVLWTLEKAGKMVGRDSRRTAGSIARIQTEKTGHFDGDIGGVGTDARYGANASTHPSTKAFVTLFYDISPAWAIRSSFCAAVQRLIDSPSPFQD